MNIHRGYLPGCIGRITALHAGYYAKAAGFGAAFEAKVAAELADFCLRHDERLDGLWLAVDGDVIHGSIAIDGSAHVDKGAHLRWFITSDECRGTGVGSRLIDAAMTFFRERGYAKAYLWTFDGLHAARHLYEKQGFRLARSQRGSQWGREVEEQLFTLGGA
ncbi:MAG TPA: GNAT family N-acetyltransferase [Burkholderiales bacterium]|nr:GNAT family N-acetyltransferase [Burkholderiales bacterium]